MFISGLSLLGGSIKKLKVPSKADTSDTGKDNRLVLEGEGGDMSLFIITPITPPEGSVPSVGLSARFAETVADIGDYAHSIDGSPYFDNPGNVSIETSNVPDGSPKALKFNAETSMYFPLSDNSLYNRKFYIRTKCFIPSNSTAYILYYCQEQGVFTDRLLIGNGGPPDQNLNVWSNQQYPSIWYGTDIGGAWREIIFHYNGSDTVKCFLDGSLVYSENFTILPYTLRYPAVRLLARTGVLLESYEIQIEGVNWLNPQLPA